MANPTLEGLPTELLFLILLEIPDLASLKSIVLSSPVFHQAYLAVRREALCRIIKNRWGMLIGDAVAATWSRGLFFDSRKHEAIALLDTWRRKEEISELGMISSNRIDEPGSVEEILHLFYLHKVFNFFLEDYAKGLPPLYPKHTHSPSGWKMPIVEGKFYRKPQSSLLSYLTLNSTGCSELCVDCKFTLISLGNPNSIGERNGSPTIGRRRMKPTSLNLPLKRHGACSLGRYHLGNTTKWPVYGHTSQ